MVKKKYVYLLGVYTFKKRQSSSPQNREKLNVVCKHFGPNSVAFKTPCHGFTFRGLCVFVLNVMSYVFVDDNSPNYLKSQFSNWRLRVRNAPKCVKFSIME